MIWKLLLELSGSQARIIVVDLILLNIAPINLAVVAYDVADSIGAVVLYPSVDELEGSLHKLCPEFRMRQQEGVEPFLYALLVLLVVLWITHRLQA